MNIKQIIREELDSNGKWVHKKSDVLFIDGYLKDIVKLTLDYADKFESFGDHEDAELMRKKAYGLSTVVMDYINK